MRVSPILIIASLVATAACASSAPPFKGAADVRPIPVVNSTFSPDSITFLKGNKIIVMGNDTIFLATEGTEERHGPLTEADFEEFAKAYGVDVAAVKAVVEIEAGQQHKGFWSEGKPIINFDISMFKRMAARNKINLSKYTSSHKEVFNRPNITKYGSQQAAVQARLDRAMDIDSVTAIEGTFWGMFQIGGFNWKQCGTSSAREFYELMSRSERDQLDLFGEFITRTGLLPSLRAKNWNAFARGYNGPSYAQRGYHRKLAAAYNKYSKKA